MPRKRKRSSSTARGRRAGSAPASQRAAAEVPGHTTRSLDNWLLGLAGLGVLLTGYLTLVAWLGEHPAYCSADSECDIVQSSRWSTLFGMPMSLWGLLTYAVLTGLAWRLRSRPSTWRTALLVACIGAGVSWFLALVSVFQIEATCGYCLASFALMNVLLVLVLLRRPSPMPEHAWRRALPFPIGAAIALVLGLHLHFNGFLRSGRWPRGFPISGNSRPTCRTAAHASMALTGVVVQEAEGSLHGLRRSAAVYRMHPRRPRRISRGRLPH